MIRFALAPLRCLLGLGPRCGARPSGPGVNRLFRCDRRPHPKGTNHTYRQFVWSDD